MPILSKRTMQDVAREIRADYGVATRFMDVSGAIHTGGDPLGRLSNVRRRRSLSLQEGLNRGAPACFEPAPHTLSWVVPLEHERMVFGGAVGAAGIAAGPDAKAETIDYLADHGLTRTEAESVVTALPRVAAELPETIARALFKTFYDMSGWRPVLMNENRQRLAQQAQLSQALREQSRAGAEIFYAFEKERALLANIRAGDRNGARRILNEMLTAVYMSDPDLAVLRARALELLGCLTRAAVEDNPLLETLIQQTHQWSAAVIAAPDFEAVSASLMQALDQYIDLVYLHGVNRSNTNVHRAIEIIGERYMEPLSLEHVAAHVGLSAGRLAHLIKQYTGRTTVDIINGVRIRRAQELLDRTDRGCAEIGYEVGFNDQSYFTRQFRRHTGLTPARYRRHRSGAEA
jgi:two-component system, response regulator YesN